MSQYKCSECGHVFSYSGKKHVVCPRCTSLYAEEIEEIDPPLFNEVPINSDLSLSIKNQVMNLNKNEVDEMTKDIEEKIKSIAGFSLEDQNNIREDILKKWKLHLQQQFEQVDEYNQKAKSLESQMKKNIADLESLARKLPTEWNEFFLNKLKEIPSYFRDLKHTRMTILEEWKESLNQFEKKFNHDWNEKMDKLTEIDGIYIKNARIFVEKHNQVVDRLQSDLDAEKTDGTEWEQNRHENWLKMHIQQLYERDRSEQNRREYWDERFSSPEQLWIVLLEERKLTQEKKRKDLIKKISDKQNTFNEFQNWYQNKKQFYYDKLQKWIDALHDL